MARIDVTMGTFKRFKQFCMTMNRLNETLDPGDLNIQIMDGNKDNDVQKFIDDNKWKFNSLKVYKESEALKAPSKGRWPIIYNYLMKKGSAPFVTFWSDDVYPDKDCFVKAIKLIKGKGKVGAVAFAWQDGSTGIYKIYGTEMHNQTTINFGIIRRSVLEKIKFIDPKYRFYNADQDLSLKIWYVGYKIVKAGQCKVTHYAGPKSSNPNRSGDANKADCNYFKGKWSYDRVKAKKVKL